MGWLVVGGMEWNGMDGGAWINSVPAGVMNVWVMIVEYRLVCLLTV